MNGSASTRRRMHRLQRPRHARLQLLHGKQNDFAATLVAFDLLELDGEDVRRAALADRKLRLARMLTKGGIEYNDQRATARRYSLPRARRTARLVGGVEAEEQREGLNRKTV
jgi:ATP-dependent DNA ligase